MGAGQYKEYTSLSLGCAPSIKAATGRGAASTKLLILAARQGTHGLQGGSVSIGNAKLTLRLPFYNEGALAI